MKTIYEQLIKELSKRLSFCESITHERITDPNGPEYIFYFTVRNSNNKLIKMRLRLALFEDEIAITTYRGDSYEASTMMFVKDCTPVSLIFEHIENATKGA